MIEIKKDQLEQIESLYKIGYYSSVVKESCTLFEVILKKIYSQALSVLPISQREILHKTEKEISNKGYNSFGFGQLVGLFNKSNLLEIWSKTTNKELGLIKSISLSYFVELRNSITHNIDNEVSKDDATLVYACLKNWLAFLGYSNIENNVSEAFNKKENGTENDKQDISSYQSHIKRKTDSNYTFSKVSEQKRLSLLSDSDKYIQLDKKAIEYALSKMDKKEQLNVIDIGCANGKILESRFGMYNFVSKAVGIDYNEKIIELNKAKHKEPFKYYCINLESEDFEEQLLSIMEKENIKSFDIVFSSLVLHHLKNPMKVIRTMSKFMSNNGAMILRGADDGTKMAYKDDGLVNEIIDKTLMVKGISDRLNGRKLYTQLYDSGFKNIKMIYEIFDTVNKSFDEKLELYQISFPYRKDYFKRQLDSDPENDQYQKDYRWICEKIDELEEKFVAPDFYYSETVPVAIGFK